MELEDALWRRQIVHLSQGGYLENGGGVITVVAPLVGGRNWDLLRDAKISGLADDCKLVMTQAQEENIAPARITEAVVEKRAKETGNEL